MVLYSIDQLESIFKTKAQKGIHYKEVSVIKLITDTRRLGNTDYSLFVALNGPSHKGHMYAEEAYKAGVRNFLTCEALPFQAYDLCVFQVKDSLKALQTLAAHHRNLFTHLQAIAITGSNGKTIVKDWLYDLISPDIHTVKSPKSYNSQVGVALSLWQIAAHHQLGIFEAGISTINEMQALEAMIQPQMGVFTHIGPAHDTGFVNWEEKIREKFKLFKNCKKLIVCADHPLVRKELKNFKGKIISVSTKDKTADYYLQRIPHEGKIKLHFKDRESILSFAFLDEISLQNINIAIASALELGVSVENIGERLMHIQPVKMRLEYKEGRENITLINDSYNSDPEALKLALQSLQRYRSDAEKWLILSDFAETNAPKNELYTQIAGWLQEYGIAKFMGIGPDLLSLKSIFPAESLFFNTTSEFLNKVSSLKLRGPASLLLKGARKFTFEQIEQFFLQKTHNTRLEINLSAIEHNLGYLRSHLPQGTKIMAMVKAFSYGAGSVEMARFLEYQKIDYLSVAYTDEGVLLRKAGIKTPILVLNIHSGNFEQLLEYNLEPEIFSKNLMQEYLHFTDQKPNQTFRYHLKIETGMHRLGLTLEDLKELLPSIASQKNLVLASAFSHLADAENASKKDFSKVQISVFKEACSLLNQYIPNHYIKHIHNSSGTLHYFEDYFNMVRLGIALFGQSENPTHRAAMKPALSLKTHISQVKELKKGDFVGYGLAYEAQYPVRIATLSIGYADGLPRSLSLEKGKVYLKGIACPIIGKVCMDMCMIVLPENLGSEGDEVEIFGESQTLEQYAAATETIPYEALTRISERVLRVYYRE